jgi:hypothetical protein
MNITQNGGSTTQKMEMWQHQYANDHFDINKNGKQQI